MPASAFASASMPASASASAFVAPVPSKPLAPIIGGITLVTKDEWSAWTGGKPNSTWTGLDASVALLEHTSPNQLHPVYVSSAQKGYNFRRTGFKIPFKPADDLISFQNTVWEHLKDTGMDSIAYLKDPTDATKMTNVVKSHARFTVQSAKLLAEAQTPLYDRYDRTNDMAARTYLLASLSTDLSNKVSEKLDDADSFPVVWLQFLKSIQSTSIERFEDLKNNIKARLPSQYPGENLEQLAAHFRKDANELTTAGQYDHNLTLGMLKTFLLAGGSGNEDFRFPLRSVKTKLEQALLDIGFKDKEAANLYMQANKLTYRDICAYAEDAFRTQFDRKEWPPSRHTRDSKAPPAAFGNLANAPITRAEVLNLIQAKPSAKGGNDTAKKGLCHNCNKPGHWSRECPEKGKPKSGGGGGKGGNDKSKGFKSWRSTPPAAGDPQTKPANGKNFMWCATCKRWTTTHSTATHTGGKKASDGSNGGAAVNNVSLVYDPSVWTTEATVAPSVTDFIFVIRKLCIRFPILCFLIYPIAMSLVPYLELAIENGIRALEESIRAAKFTMAVFAAVDWMQVIDQVKVQIAIIWETLVTFVATHNYALLVPVLWIILMILLLWFPFANVNPIPPEPDPIPKLTRRQRRAIAKKEAKFQQQTKAKHIGSIRSHGLHRRYPIKLRDMGHFIRANAPTLAEQQYRLELDGLHSKETNLVRKIDSPSRMDFPMISGFADFAKETLCMVASLCVLALFPLMMKSLLIVSMGIIRHRQHERREKRSIVLETNLAVVLVVVPSQMVSIVLSLPPVVMVLGIIVGLTSNSLRLAKWLCKSTWPQFPMVTTLP